MADRFERLYKLPDNLYSDESPIIISAGALLKDNDTGCVIAQLKFQSVSPKHISAVKVSVSAYDVSGAEIQGVQDYQYLDINVFDGQEFGSNRAIIMPSSVTRRIDIRSITVVFSDGSTWGSTSAYRPLPAAKTLEQHFGDLELAKQYRICTNDVATVTPTEEMFLWRCSCGKWNRGLVCTNCNISRERVLTHLEIHFLTELKNSRLAREKYQQEEQARIEAERVAKQREIDAARRQAAQKRNRVIAIIGTPLLVIALIFVLIINPFILQPKLNYEKALEFVESAKYEEAYDLFLKLGDYKDSKQYLGAFEWVCVEECASGDYCSTFEHDEHGRMVKHFKDYYEYETLDATYYYTYDDFGKLTMTTKKDDDGEIDSITTYLYNDSGLLIEEHDDWTYFEYLTKYAYDKNGYLVHEEYFKRDKDEDPEFALAITTTYVNDAEGNMIEKTVINEDGKETKYRYFYDQNGLCIEWIRFSDQKVYKYSRMFDDYGRVTSCVETRLNGSTQKITYKYGLVFHFDKYLADLDDETIYQKAQQMIQEGQYRNAVALFMFLGEYKDSQDKITEIMSSNIQTQCYLSSVGDVVIYGQYEQDNDVTNGAESIEWIILKKTDKSVFLVSKYCLSAQQYHISDDNVLDWKNCTLREWLNNDFIGDAFTRDQQAALTFNEDGDLCSILTLAEFDSYCSDYDYKISHYTPYAHSIGGSFLKDYTEDFPNSWWIRSSSYRATDFGYWYKDVSHEGKTEQYASPVSLGGVRPCIYIKIS